MWKIKWFQAHHMYDCVKYSNVSDMSNMLWSHYYMYIGYDFITCKWQWGQSVPKIWFQSQMRISALWTKLHTHSLICELPSILFFYFLLKVIAWSFLITFLWNYQEIMLTENPLLMFISLCEHWLICTMSILI